MPTKSRALEILEQHAKLRQLLGENLMAAAGRAEDAPAIHPGQLLSLQADDLVLLLVNLGAEVLNMSEQDVGSSSMTRMLLMLRDAVPEDARALLAEASCLIHTMQLARFYQAQLQQAKAGEKKTWLNPAIYAPQGVRA